MDTYPSREVECLEETWVDVPLLVVATFGNAVVWLQTAEFAWVFGLDKTTKEIAILITNKT